MATLTREEVLRYSRHLTLPEVGEAGQQKLKGARVLCVGVGGLGSPASLYLAAAGVGTLGLVEFDRVDVTNLQRQILYGTADVGQPKLDAAARRLTDLNPHVRVEAHAEPLTASNAMALVQAYDVVLDGTDNFPARYLVNDACVLTGTPNAYGSIFRFEGQASVFAAPGGPCYRCLHPEPPPPGLVPSCAEGGVLGVLPGIIGTIQAAEAIKLILGAGEPLVGRFLVFDALRMRFRELKLRKDPECPVCGETPRIRELQELADYCTPVPGRHEETMPTDMTVTELKARMDKGDAPTLIDVREPSEHQICNIPGATLIPMAQVPSRLGEFDPNAEIVIHCKSGGRSAKVAAFMREKGFTNVHNLAGGVLAWIDQVDPTQAKY